MISDEIPDSLCFFGNTDGGDTCRKRVEHRGFSQSSLSMIETDRSQAGSKNSTK